MLDGYLIDCSNNSNIYLPCADTTVERSDGFTFGIAFASKDSFQRNRTIAVSLQLQAATSTAAAVARKSIIIIICRLKLTSSLTASLSLCCFRTTSQAASSLLCQIIHL
ncbi:hypothetical protein COP1_044406 [Malus domestica]